MLANVEWHWGFLRACRFSLDGDRRAGHDERALAAFAELIAHPSARFLRELDLGVTKVPHDHHAAAIEVLGRHDLRTLRRLVIGDVECDTKVPTSVWTTRIGRTRPLYGACAGLRSLTLLSNGDEDTQLDGIALPELRELRVRGCVDPAPLFAAPWPELERLELEGSFPIPDEAWRPLLDGDRFPRLRHLTFGVYSVLAGRCGALFATARVVRRLETLDLRHTLLDDDDARAFVRHRAAFAHLQHLDLSALIARDAALDAEVRRVCRDVRMLTRA